MSNNNNANNNSSYDTLQNGMDALMMLKEACRKAANDLSGYLHCLDVTQEALRMANLEDRGNTIFGRNGECVGVVDVLRKEHRMINEVLRRAIKVANGEGGKD